MVNLSLGMVVTSHFFTNHGEFCELLSYLEEVLYAFRLSGNLVTRGSLGVDVGVE